MSVVSSGEFARLLTGLDRETRLRLLADLLEARGREVEHLPGGLSVTNPETGETRTLRLVSRPRGVAGDDDAVVDPYGSDRIRSRARAAGARYLGPDGLRDLLLYGIDRGRADELFQRYFDRPLDVPSPDRSRVPELAAYASALDRRALVAVSLILVLGVAGALAGLSGAPPSGGRADAEVGTTASPVGSVTPVDVGNATGGGDAERRGTAGSARRSETSTPKPLSVALSGEHVDAEALARNHVVALSMQSYRWVVEYNGTRDTDGRQWVHARQSVAVATHRTYARTLTGARLATDRSVQPVRVDAYANGEALYRRVGSPDDPTYERYELNQSRTADRFARRSSTHVVRYLSTTHADVRRVLLENNRVYRIEATGTPTALSPVQPGANGGSLSPPFGNVTNYTAVAYVQPPGIVFSLDVRFTVDGRPVRFRYDLYWYEPVHVERPSWYETARNATDGNESVDTVPDGQ